MGSERSSQLHVRAIDRARPYEFFLTKRGVQSASHSEHTCAHSLMLRGPRDAANAMRIGRGSSSLPSQRPTRSQGSMPDVRSVRSFPSTARREPSQVAVSSGDRRIRAELILEESPSTGLLFR